MELVYDKILSFLSNKFTNFSEKYPNLYVLIKECRIGINSIYIDGTHLLIYAIKDNNVNFATFLLYHGVNVNLKGHLRWTVLHHSVFYDNVELVKLFLEYDADINIRSGVLNLTALNINARSRTKQAVRKIIRNIELLNVTT